MNIQSGGEEKPGTESNSGLLNKISGFINFNSYDLVAFQEVSGNFGIFGGVNVKKIGLDTFSYFKKNLNSMKGVLFSFSELTDIPDNYWGVAVFYKSQRFELIKSENIYTCDKNIKRLSSFNDWQNNATGFIAVKLKDKGTKKIFWFLTGHLSWGPVGRFDSEFQRSAAMIMVKYIKSLKEPVITTIDMNVEWFTKTAVEFEEAGLISLSRKYNIQNTLNPLQTRHYENIFIKDNFASKKGGVACDNIYLTKGIKENNFEVIKENFSDHYGLSSELELVS